MKDDITILDVRSEDEWRAGHVSGAIHFSLDKLMTGEMPDIKKEANIITYCRSGSRSEMARHLLENKGFSKVTNGGSLNDVASKYGHITRGD